MSRLSLSPIVLALTITLVSINLANGQNKNIRMSAEEYIAAFKDAAIMDMQKTGVPASITLAQGMYESDYGNSPLATNAKNHFGIKCHKEWNGDTFHQDDDELNECFRKYNSVQESYDDHSFFLRNRDRYSFLFKLSQNDYKGWAHGLKKAGYATNPQYAQKLIDLIEKYNLNQYDLLATAAANTIPSKAQDQNNSTPQESVIVKHTEKNKTPVSDQYAGIINDVPVVRALKGDTWLKLSREHELELWQLLEYNDADQTTVLKEGDLVFIRPKKNKGSEETYTVKGGETMRQVAQMYGVRLSKLYKMNQLDSGAQPEPGQVLYLRKSTLLGVVL